MKKKVALLGVCTALALIFSYIELLIPIHFGIPGAKLGLANLVTVFVLYQCGWKDSLVVSIVRITVSGFLFSNMFSIVYSLSGALLSLAAMTLLKRTNRFSVVGVSAAGGVVHNIGQLLVAVAVVETYSIGYYLPVLIIAGVITGTLIGFISKEVLKRIVNVPYFHN